MMLMGRTRQSNAEGVKRQMGKQVETEVVPVSAGKIVARKQTVKKQTVVGKTIAPVVNIPAKVSESTHTVADNVQHLTENITLMADTVRETTTAAWERVFALLQVRNPFAAAIAKNPQGFGLQLRDGTFLPVRVLTAEDNAAVKKFLENLSPESRYTRFHYAMPVVQENIAYRLSDRDGYHRVALIALSPDSSIIVHRGEDDDEAITENGTYASEDIPTIVAMAEYALPSAPDEEGNYIPEVAIVVADEWHKKGVATQMLKVLATLSIAGGHNTWEALVLTSNPTVKQLLKKVGKVKTVSTVEGVNTFRVKLSTQKIFSE